MRKKRRRRPAEVKCLLFLFSVRAGLGVLVLAFFAFLWARSFIFVTLAGAGSRFVGARALLASFASEHGQREEGHGGESEEEFFHNEDFIFGTRSAEC